MSQQTQPLTHAEENTLHDLFKQLGWVSTTRIQDEFRYSVNTDKVCCLTSKKSIVLPVRTFKTWAVVTFKCSFAFQIRFLNEQTVNLITFIATNLQNVTKQAQLQHNFYLEGMEGKVLRAVEDFIPDGQPNEGEQTFNNLLRVNLLNKYSHFPELNTAFLAATPRISELVHLKPTFSLPWEYKEGYPAYRHTNTLIMTNDEQDEYLVTEPGYFTFFHDMTLNRVLVRSYFESHSPFILLSLWKDTDFKLAELIAAWVQFARQQLTNLTAIIEFPDFDKNLLQEISLEKKLIEKGTDTVFPLSPLALDSRMASNASIPPWKYLTKPPTSFEEMEAVQKYSEGVQAYRSGKYREAIALSVDALKGFNRFGQKQGVLLTLLNMSLVAKKGARLAEAEKYLKDALILCKSGEIKEDLIVRVQSNLGVIKLRMNQPTEAIDAFQVAIQSLEGRPTQTLRLKMRIAKIKLKILRSYVVAGNFAQAKLESKEVMRFAKDQLKGTPKLDEFMVRYFLEEAYHAEKRENISQAILAFRKAAILEKKVKNRRLMLTVLISLARLVLIHRKNATYALKFLQRAEEILTKKKRESTAKLIQVYELMSDAYDIQKDGETARVYSKRAADLRRALQIRSAQQ